MNYLKYNVLLLFIYGCVNKTAVVDDNSEKLEGLINSYQDCKRYDEKAYPLGVYTKSYYKAEAEYAQKKLDELSRIDPSGLSETEQISSDLLKFILQDKIDYYTFECYLNPLLSDAGFHTDLTYIVRPLVNYEQVKEYLNKLNAIPEFVNQHITNLREGLGKGMSQSRVIFNGYESSYNDHVVDDYKNSFYYAPFKNLPESLTTAQKDSVLVVAKTAIEAYVTPQFERIKNFFETEYLPKTRNTIGALNLPNGNDFYQNRINFYTTSTSYSADDIHQIGLTEVARIKVDMQNIIRQLNFHGSLADFIKFLRTDKRFYAKTAKELLIDARDMSKRLDAQLPKFFKTLPRKPYGVAPVPDAIAPKYTGGRYIGTSKNSTEPGYYWVNTYDLPSRPLYTLPALTAHEAVPGHHLQMSLNNELGDSIPQFRKDLYLSAYGEGWGLYSEFLADEMNLYTTPYEQFGKLTYEMWRACRLVVDTGIHAKGWTREQVVDYMASNTALSMLEVNTEADRYISWPGQALSYKMGELKIRELRRKSENALSAKFDIRDFHEIILEEGTVTLSIMEKRINQYIENNK